MYIYLSIYLFVFLVYCKPNEVLNLLLKSYIYLFVCFCYLQLRGTGSDTVLHYPVGHDHVMLRLQSEDTVTLMISPSSSPSNSPAHITFSGHLIFEEKLEEEGGEEV